MNSYPAHNNGASSSTSMGFAPYVPNGPRYLCYYSGLNSKGAEMTASGKRLLQKSLAGRYHNPPNPAIPGTCFFIQHGLDWEAIDRSQKIRTADPHTVYLWDTVPKYVQQFSTVQQVSPPHEPTVRTDTELSGTFSLGSSTSDHSNLKNSSVLLVAQPKNKSKHPLVLVALNPGKNMGHSSGQRLVNSHPVGEAPKGSQISGRGPSTNLRPQRPPTPLKSPRMKSVNLKQKYVDGLVETTALVIQSIWMTQYASKKTKVVDLRTFIKEVLRRSRSTYSVLQAALFYLFRVKNLIIKRQKERQLRETREEQTEHSGVQRTEDQGESKKRINEDDLIGCGRRMFLAALMLSSKYLQDKNYRNTAWAKIAQLSVKEINATEMAFLKLIDYNLFISKDTFDRWYTLLHNHVSTLCDLSTRGDDALLSHSSFVGEKLTQISEMTNRVQLETPESSPESLPRSPVEIGQLESASTTNGLSLALDSNIARGDAYATHDDCAVADAFDQGASFLPSPPEQRKRTHTEVDRNQDEQHMSDCIGNNVYRVSSESKRRVKKPRTKA